MKHVGVVSSEDGLLLLGDAVTLQAWRGLDEEPTHFARLTAAFAEGAPGIEIRIKRKVGVLWDIEGPGTTDIFSDEEQGKILLVRCWLSDTGDEMAAIQALASAPDSLSSTTAELRIETGLLGILWPTESGSCIRKRGPSSYALTVDDMMTESSGMLLPVLNGQYRCFYDSVNLECGEARRCHLVRVM